MLSTKHSQQTDSEEITFDNVFDQVFDIYSNEVTLGSNTDLSSGLLIQLGPVTIEETDDGDAFRIEYFDLVDFNGEVKGRVQEQHGFPMYLANEMILAYKQAAGHPIPIMRFDDMDDDTPLFNIEIKSKAVTASFQQMLQILDSKDHMGNTYDLDGMCQKYAEILLEAGVKYPFVHAEMVIKGLLRKKGKELEVPDFGPNGDHEDYEILRLTWSLRKNLSPVIRFSTGWLKSSLISPSLYESHEPSHFDALLVPNLNDVI